MALEMHPAVDRQSNVAKMKQPSSEIFMINVTVLNVCFKRSYGICLKVLQVMSLPIR